ncbi:hypothetical protein VNO77_34565 [Canavalia gladiata]|uniref:Uncharacterized protein n=1 Tax=Canavalia gladiata TaxID=3824 RepID=A0AAN9PXC2_CANGL
MDKHFPVETNGYTLIDSRKLYLANLITDGLKCCLHSSIIIVIRRSSRVLVGLMGNLEYILYGGLGLCLGQYLDHSILIPSIGASIDFEFGKMSFGAKIWPLKSLVSHPHWHICAEHSGLLICK